MENKKLRSVNTHFWNDTYVENLDPIEKLLFLYFLTNPLTNLAGIYEIPIRRIAFDTGIDKDMVIKIINRFSKDNKVYYIKGYIILVNFMKNQKYSSTMLTNVQNTIKDLPNEVKTQFSEITQYPIDRVSIPYREVEEEVEVEIENESEEETAAISQLIEQTILESGLSESQYNKLWLTTFGRLPKIPEMEITNELLQKFGFEKLKLIYKQASLKGFRNLDTLKNSLDNNGNIKPKGDNGINKGFNGTSLNSKWDEFTDN